MISWQLRRRQKVLCAELLQLLPVRLVLHILIWQRKVWKKQRKAHDCSIKVETRGSGGAKNVLTDEEIADADCIIVAADAKVPMDRFDGKTCDRVSGF